MPLTLTLNFPPITFTIDDETMRSSLTISMQASQSEQPGQQSRPLADAAIAAQDRIMATQIAEQPAEDSAVPSDEELLGLVKNVVNTSALGLTHAQDVLKSLGVAKVSLLDAAGRLAFRIALQDALTLRAAK